MLDWYMGGYMDFHKKHSFTTPYILIVLKNKEIGNDETYYHFGTKIYFRKMNGWTYLKCDFICCCSVFCKNTSLSTGLTLIFIVGDLAWNNRTTAFEVHHFRSSSLIEWSWGYWKTWGKKTQNFKILIFKGIFPQDA